MIPVHLFGEAHDMIDNPDTDTGARLAWRMRHIRHGARVERCHGIPHQGSYSNAAHQWGVAALMYVLWPEDFPRLAPICLFHDIPEAWVGDIPGPVQHHSRDVKTPIAKMEREITSWLDIPSEHTLAEEDRIKFKICDWMEFYLWTLDQGRLGNREADESRVEVESYLDTAALPSPADEFYRYIRKHGALPAKAAGVIRKAVSGELNLETVQGLRRQDAA